MSAAAKPWFLFECLSPSTLVGAQKVKGDCVPEAVLVSTSRVLAADTAGMTRTSIVDVVVVVVVIVVVIVVVVHLQVHHTLLIHHSHHH